MTDSRAATRHAVLLRSAPRLHPRLVAAIDRLHDPALGIAETNRRVGELADRNGLPRPSYERVRLLVHRASRRFPDPTTGEVLLDIAFRSRPPQALATTSPARSRRDEGGEPNLSK